MTRLRSVAALILTSVAVQWSGCSSTVSTPPNAPKLSVPATIDFGLVRVGLMKDTSVRFTNTGTDALSITSQGFSAPQFLLADTSQKAFKIDAGGYQDVRIRFMPTDSNSITANDTVNSNAGATVMVLHGGGIALTRTIQIPGIVNVADTRIGLCEDGFLGARTVDTIWFTNGGNDSLRLSAVTIQPSTFSINDYSRVVAPGGSGFLRYIFCPTQIGATTGTVTIVSNATPDSVKTLTLTANGLRYMPGVGSVYTFNAALDSLDGVTGKTVFVGAPGFHFDTIISASASFSGQTGLIEVSDPGPHNTYYKILPNGDIQTFGDGAPVAQGTLYGSTWWTLPSGSHTKSVNLFTGDTMVKNGTIKLHVTETASYMGDTTMTIGTRQHTGSILQIVIAGTYGPGSNPNYVKGMQFIFLPDIGYLGQKIFSEYSPILNINHGAAAILTNYNLK